MRARGSTRRRPRGSRSGGTASGVVPRLRARPPLAADAYPYAILVSEVMAQQTQVERVVSRWIDWLDRWPTAAALASASTADVIRAWQGLGYNRRALSLQRAARHVAEHGWPAISPSFPASARTRRPRSATSRSAATSFPSIRTSAASRTAPASRSAPAAAQALMDLGATVCLARIPRCDACPLAEQCTSRGRRYAPLRKQSRFEGSFRQQRARACGSSLRRHGRSTSSIRRPSSRCAPMASSSSTRPGSAAGVASTRSRGDAVGPP